MKQPDAFRTIGEAADVVGVAPHVLRFWEERFPAIKPVKRAGGRRYYRPADVALLIAIRRLLHDEGRTIAGVQKLIAEQGARAVAGLGDAPEPAPGDWRGELRAMRGDLAAALGAATERRSDGSTPREGRRWGGSG